MKPKEILAIIPARGGSKGIPDKNIKPFCGKPLIGYSIEQAKMSKLISRIIVSSDDDNILSISSDYGADVIRRPKELSGDTASSESALIHVLEELEKKENYIPDLVMFMQATSPIRNYEDLDAAIVDLGNDNADSLLSVTESHRFIWHYKNGIAESINYDYKSRTIRQDLPPEYIETGSFYLFKPWVLKELKNRLGGKISFYKINFWHSFEIDTYDDFELCEWIYKYKA